MGIGYNPKIITDSLVVNIDIGNTSKSYFGESTTNLITNGDFQTLTGWNVYAGSELSIETVNDFPFTGGPNINALKMVANANIQGGGNFGGVSFAAPTMANAEPYSVSFYMKSVTGNTTCSFSHQSGSGDNSNLAVGFVATSNWTRISKSVDSLSSTKPTMFVWMSNASATTYLANFQIENLNYATPFTSSSRSIIAKNHINESTPTLTQIGSNFYSDSLAALDFGNVTGNGASTASQGITFSTNPVTTTGNFTFEAWVKDPPTNGQIGFFSNAGGANGFRFGPGRTGLYIAVGPTWSEPTLSYGGSDLIDGLWHQVVGVYDRVSSPPKLICYLDGTYRSEFELTEPQTEFTNVAPGLVRCSCCSLYNGKIGLFRVYNKALSGNEVKTNFNANRKRYNI